MKVFVTGASGFVGSAVVQELLGAGHQVLGLARSDASASAIEKAGAQVHRGSLTDLESLERGAAAADGVIHTAFVHDDFSKMAEAGVIDLAAIEAMGSVLKGKPLVVTNGLAGLAQGRVALESDPSGPGARFASDRATFALAEKGVRATLVRLPPTVHGENDPNFLAHLVRIAKANAVSAYPGDGTNRWSAVHRLDAATVYRLALEKGVAGSVFHAVAEEGLTTRQLAEAIGRVLGVPTASLNAEALTAKYTWLARFFSLDMAASSEATRAALDWQPKHPTVVADLEAGHYTRA